MASFQRPLKFFLRAISGFELNGDVGHPETPLGLSHPSDRPRRVNLSPD